MKHLLVAALLLCGCKLSCLAPQAERIEAPIATTLEAPPGGEAFDHSAFDALVKAHANPKSGRVDYAALKQQEAALDAYLKDLGSADVSRLGRNDRKALLINAYNAFTLKLILENYPGIASIKDLSSPWKQARWKLAGETLSLDDIEHGLLRPIYEDARIHFAVNCASIGCPPLADFAFDGARLDEQLDDVTRAAMNNERYARVDGETLRLTALMNWYGDDFGDVSAFVAKYRDDVPAEAGVTFLDYDWSLNDTKP